MPRRRLTIEVDIPDFWPEQATRSELAELCDQLKLTVEAFERFDVPLHSRHGYLIGKAKLQ